MARAGGWTPRSAALRFVELLRDEGPRTLWFKVWGELLYRRLALYELPLDSDPPPVSAGPLAVAPLSAGDEREYATLRPGAEGAEIAPRIAAGHRCFVARRDQRLVASCWVAHGQLWSTVLRRRIALGPGEALTYETYTGPDARGLGVGAAMRTEIARILQDEGCQRLLATVEPESPPAIGLVEKIGYRRIGTIGYLGAGRWRRHFLRLSGGALPPGSAGVRPRRADANARPASAATPAARRSGS